MILDVATDVQASLLSFVGQQAIAHAAAIFATLTAAFTFATVQKKLDGDRTAFCVFILSILLAGSIYAGLRLYYYGLLSGIIQGYHGESNQTLTQYWGNVTKGMFSGVYGGPSTFFYVQLGLGQTIQSLSISYVLGFMIAVGVASYSIGNECARGWRDTLHLLPLRLKFWLCLAGFTYLLEITLVRKLIYVFGNFWAVVIALLLATVGSLILAMWKWFNRKKMN